MLPCPRCKIEDAQDESCQYDVQTLARHLRKDTFQRLQAAEDDKKAVEIWNQHQAEFSKKLQEIAAEYEKQESFRLAQLNEEATKAFLVKTMPNALQCPQCGLGPVDLKGWVYLGFLGPGSWVIWGKGSRAENVHVINFKNSGSLDFWICEPKATLKVVMTCALIMVRVYTRAGRSFPM